LVEGEVALGLLSSRIPLNSTMARTMPRSSSANRLPSDGDENMRMRKPAVVYSCSSIDAFTVAASTIYFLLLLFLL